MAAFSFVANKIETPVATNTGALKPGIYHMVIVRTDRKRTKAGTGEYLEFEMQVVQPAEFSGRRYWDRFNISNPNKKTEDIAAEQLSDLCHAVGVKKIEADTDELLDKELVITLEIDPKNTDFLRIKQYEAVPGPDLFEKPAQVAIPQSLQKRPWG